MRKKIQQQGSHQEQSSPVTLGVISTAEEQDSSCSPRNDSQKVHHDCKATGCSSRPPSFTDQSKNNRKLMDFLPVAKVMIVLVMIYQKIISPWLPVACRFSPTCSHYAIESLTIHGLFKGSLLTIWRLLRCQPFCKGGFDPVPLSKNNIKKGSNSEI